MVRHGATQNIRLSCKVRAHLQKFFWKNSLSLAVKFYSSFNFVEIAFIRFVCKQCFHTLTYSQFSTLIVHLYFSSTLSFCTFLKKYQKRGSRVRHSVLKVDNIAFSHPVRCKLCLHCARLYAVNVVDLQSKFKSCFATSFSRCTPRRSLLVAMLGVARTRCAQTSCHLFPSIARLLAVPPNAALPPLAGNYLLQ